MSKYERDQMEKYNGWHNYATWRINLEIFDGFDLEDMAWHRLEQSDLAEALKQYAEEIVFMDCKDGLASDYARAFMSDVNWYEIAEHLLEDYKQESEAE